MNIVLISTYELGRQPFGLASPAAWLRAAGMQVTSLDLAKERLCADAIRQADLIAFYLPMHTATRIAVGAIERVRQLNPWAHLVAYGLYAPLNADFLRGLGIGTILGGEFEAALVSVARRLRAGSAEPGAPSQVEPSVSLTRLPFVVPDRAGLPPLARYAKVCLGDGSYRTAGYTEASRGCKHLCRHCPVVPVYNGTFRIVPREIVLQDIRAQVAAGAEHITFGDPDFFNGIGHAIPLVRSLHAEFPALSFDVTIKIEHLRKHAEHLAALRDTGCLFVTSAAESVDDEVLARLAKNHTRADFIWVARRCREAGLPLVPTFVAFTPWTRVASYRRLLRDVAALDLIDHVAPIQLALRLLIPAGSRLLELAEVREMVGAFDPRALVFPWTHRDPRVDRFHLDVRSLVASSETGRRSRREVFAAVWDLAHEYDERPAPPLPTPPALARAAVPYLNEPWYC